MLKTTAFLAARPVNCDVDPAKPPPLSSSCKLSYLSLAPRRRCMTVTVCVPICQIIALMVCVAVLTAVLPVIDIIDSQTHLGRCHQQSLLRRNAHLYPKHRDNSTFIHRHYKKTKRHRHSRARRSQDAGNAYAQQPPASAPFGADWLVSQRTDKVRRLIGHQHYTCSWNLHLLRRGA
jgi:hypothetical protein